MTFDKTVYLKEFFNSQQSLRSYQNICFYYWVGILGSYIQIETPFVKQLS